MPKKDQAEKYSNDPAFCEFVLKEVDSTITVATVEELADFAFGSMSEAIAAFKESKRTLI